MKGNEIMTTVYESINNMRKVSKLGIEKEELIKYGATIDFINAGNRKGTIINCESDSVLLNEFKIWRPFKELILPRTLTITGDVIGMDLLPTCQMVWDDGTMLNAVDFTQVSLKLNAAFHGSNDQIVDVQRQDMTLTKEIALRTSYNNKVGASLDSVPIPIKTNFLFQQGTFYVVPESNFWLNYIIKLLYTVK